MVNCLHKIYGVYMYAQKHIDQCFVHVYTLVLCTHGNILIHIMYRHAEVNAYIEINVHKYVCSHRYT